MTGLKLAHQKVKIIFSWKTFFSEHSVTTARQTKTLEDIPIATYSEPSLNYPRARSRIISSDPRLKRNDV